MEPLRLSSAETVNIRKAQLEAMVDGMFKDLRIEEAARAVALSVSADDDWEMVRASDLNRLRDELGIEHG